MAIYTNNPRSDKINVRKSEISDVYLTSPFNKDLSLINIMTSLELYEGIFQHTITGNLTILDTDNLITSYPIAGYEKINIILKSGSNWFEDSFSIYSITDLEEQRGQGKSYTLQLISEEYLENKYQISRHIT